MVGRVVEIASDGRHLAVERGFLTVAEKGAEVGRLPLDDLAAVVANAHGLTYSNNLLVTLATRGVPVVLCGPNHQPAALVWPVDGHHAQAGRMSDQAGASAPLKKRLWQQIVRAKILEQGAALAATGAEPGGFRLLARKVRPGDPDNVEAEAARRYWPLLFGPQFRRDTEGGGLNGLLNYGYAILRAATARAVMAAGLHPSLGLMHSNRGNALVLVDDLMEPFRPIARCTGSGSGTDRSHRRDKGRAGAHHGRRSVNERRSQPADDLPRPARRITRQGLCGRERAARAAQTRTAAWILRRIMAASADGRPAALSGYRIMWLVVLFDLPVGTKKERKAATRFRLKLLDLGFEMTQYSVYLRFCAGKEQAEAYERKIEQAMPASGKVHIIAITDKQYENIRTYRGRNREQSPKNPDQFVLL
jgi:CRISP-associated protein Cas1